MANLVDLQFVGTRDALENLNKILCGKNSNKQYVLNAALEEDGLLGYVVYLEEKIDCIKSMLENDIDSVKTWCSYEIKEAIGQHERECPHISDKVTDKTLWQLIDHHFFSQLLQEEVQETVEDIVNKVLAEAEVSIRINSNSFDSMKCTNTAV